MDKTVLVDQDIEGGRRLVQALDEERFPVVASLWLFIPEESAWRLLIASPRVGELGPRATYAIIQGILVKKRLDLPLYRISVVTPGDPLVGELRVFAGTDPAPFVGRTSLQNTVVGDLYVEGAYIYRAERIIGKTGSFDRWSVSPDKDRKVWVARRCKVTVDDGCFKNIEVQDGTWPQTHAKNGINASLGVLINPEQRDGQTFGDVQRWTILGGRLRSVETVARGVPVDGYTETPASAGSAT
jgi:hypothetical protein